MSISVITNRSAMHALRQLNSSKPELEDIQARMNTGRKINGAKDNGAIYGMAQTLRSDISGWGAVTDSLDTAISTGEVALSATEALNDLLLEMKEKALEAADPAMDSRGRSILNEDFTVLRNQIDTVVRNAQFNGINLIDGSATGIYPVTDVNGGHSVSMQGFDLRVGGSDSSVTATTVIDPLEAAREALERIKDTLDAQNLITNHFGGRIRTMETTRTLAVNTSDVLAKNLGNLVDADLGKEAARLQAAQTKQQLRVQALNIANQIPTFAARLFGQ